LVVPDRHHHRPLRPDPDERFSLHPREAEEVLANLLDSPGPMTHHESDDDEEAPEGGDS